ncbi:hypothetical protein ACFVXQ_35615, partial [Kitasatospora sp. NPDC058263]
MTSGTESDAWAGFGTGAKPCPRNSAPRWTSRRDSNRPWVRRHVRRAIARGRGGGDPAAIQRLLFLPRYEAAYRRVLDAHRPRILPLQVGLREAPEVACEMAAAITDRLRAPSPRT